MGTFLISFGSGTSYNWLHNLIDKQYTEVSNKFQ